MHRKNNFSESSLARLLIAIVWTAGVTGSARADFKDDIDFTKLKNEYGAALPDGRGVKLAQIEYIRASAWAPFPSGELAGKVFNYRSTLGTAYSSHANEVGAYLAGSATSMTPGIEGWDCFEAVNFTNRGQLNGGRSFAPNVSTWDIENHSWGGNDTVAVEKLRRMDNHIEFNNSIAVVGVDNASTMSMMLANSYNCIAVGTSTGAHPQNGSSMDLVGRMKPDIVGTATWTSYATPIVASSAAILVGEINRTPALGAARHPLAVKAILMAGATKSEFPGWQNSPTRPLDNIYGAGEVNIYNSYKLLVAGRQAASSSNSVAISGWDVNTSSTGRRLYFINVPAGKLLNLSAILTWYRHVSANPLWSVLTPTLQNLDLVLWRADSSYKLGAEVYRSSSVLDNVEHIYSKSLGSGYYALEVLAPVDNETYSLAWHGELQDDPNGPPPAPPGFANLYSSGDIGSVGVAGYTNYNAGADEFTISGAGADIAAFKDAFHFAYAGGNGDLELITRIESFSAGDPAAKAGLMIRDSLSANAAHASVFSTAANSITFARRPVNGGSTTSTTATNVSLPLLVKLRRAGNVVTAYYSTDGAVWATLGAAEVTIRASAQVGLAVTSKSTGGLATARFTQTALNTGISSATLNGLTLYQVGSSKISASAAAGGGILSLTGTGYILPGGSNREGSAFLSARGNGDGAISTQVLAPRAGAVPMRAGLMIRESLLDNAMYVALTRTNSNYVSFEYRTANGGYATTRLISDPGRYLLLDRRGNTFTALASSDGASWRTLGTVTVYLRSNPHQGVFVISSSQTNAVTADFEQPVTAP